MKLASGGKYDKHTPVAQLAEQRSPKPQVGGSSPSWRATRRGDSSSSPNRKARGPMTGPCAGRQRKSSMNAKVEQVGGNSAADIAKLTLALAILAAGVFSYYWFNDLPGWQRLLL